MRRVHVSPELVMSMDRTVLSSLFEAVGEKRLAALGKRRAPQAAASAFARALHGVAMDDAAADVVDELARTACDAGCRALDEALGDPALGVVKSHAFAARPDETHVDHVARLLAMRERDRNPDKRALLARVFARVRLRLDRWLPPRPSYDVVVDHQQDREDPPERDQSARIVRELRAALGDAFVDAFVDEQQERVHIAVLHRAPLAAHSVAGDDDDGGARSRVTLRPLLADELRFDRATRRLFVVTARPKVLGAYAAAISRAFSGERAETQLRAPAPSLSLKWIQSRGAAALREVPLPRGVVAMDVVGCQWSSGKGMRREARGPGALAALEDGAPLAGGYLTRLTLRLRIEGAAHPVDVFIQLPHRLSFSDMRWETEARAVLDALHVFEPGALPDDAHTLAPFEQPEWRWVAVLGHDAFARLARKKLLVRVKTRRVATAEYRPLGHTFVVQDIPGEDGKYAMAEDESVAARTVGDDATAMWQLDVAKLARAMREDLATAAAASAHGSHAEKDLVDLGVLTLASGKIHFFFALRPAGRRALEGATLACPIGVTPVVLVPAGRRFEDVSLRQVELSLEEQLGAASIAWDTAKVAESLGAADQIEAWRRAGAGVDVVIERGTQRVWLFGALLVHLSENLYKLFECLAVNAGRVVPVKELGMYVSPHSSAPDALVRRVRAEIRARVTKSLKEGGVKLTADVGRAIDKLAAKKGRAGYTMELAVKVM